MATRAQRRAAPSLGNYSNRIVRGLAQTTRYMDPGLAERWTEMVGPELAALCRPGRLTGRPGSGRTLEVIVSNGAAATRVTLHQTDIVAAANRVLGPSQVARLTIRQNTSTSADTNTGANKASPARTDGGGATTLAGVLDRFRRS
ncbi:MAG: DUF721 domain-containing protein [Pseudomonadota bacterium]